MSASCTSTTNLFFGLPLGAVTLLNPETKGGLRPVAKAMARVLGHAGACTHAVSLALQLVDELEHALGETAIGVVGDLLLNRYDSDAAFSQRLLVNARLGGVAHETGVVGHDDAANLGAGTEDVLQHLAKLGAIVVRPADAPLYVFAQQLEPMVLSVLADGRDLSGE
jgi:hypothetical protein